MPSCACCLVTSVESADKCSGSGSGLCAKLPVISSLITVISVTPSARSSCGTAMAPVELMASTTTRKFILVMAGTFTQGNWQMASICFSRWLVTCICLPSLFTGAKTKASSAAICNSSAPSSALMNSPFSFSSFNAFHSLGLWLAVKMIPPAAASATTAISTVGVVLRPKSATSKPILFSVPVTRLLISSPLMRPSRPITILLLVVFFCSNMPKAAVYLTTSSGDSVSPGFPPMVPRMPEMLFINAIACLRFSFSLQRYLLFS